MGKSNTCLILESNKNLVFGKTARSDTNLPDGSLMRLEGVFATMGKKNRNNRTYDHINYENVLDKRVRPLIEKNALLGESEHALDENVNYNNVSHLVESIEYDPYTKQYTGSILLLDTDKGRNAYAIAKAGTPLFISSRAKGSVGQDGKVELSQLITYDITASPGFEEAMFTPSNGNRVVEESFVFESLDEGWASMARDTTYVPPEFENIHRIERQYFGIGDDADVDESLNNMGMENDEDYITVGEFDEYMQTEIVGMVDEKISEINESGVEMDERYIIDEVTSNVIADNNERVLSFIRETFDGYNNDVLIPYIENYINKAGMDNAPRDFENMIQESINEYGNEVLIPYIKDNHIGNAGVTKEEISDMIDKRVDEALATVQTYAQEEIVPAAVDESMRAEIDNAPNLDDIEYPVVGEIYTAKAPLKTTDNNTIFEKTKFVVESVNFDDEIIKIKLDDGSEDCLCLEEFEKNVESCHNKKTQGGMPGPGGSTGQGGSPGFLNRAPGGFDKMVPKKYKDVWESLSQTARDKVAAQAGMRNLETDSDINNFFNTRDFDALKKNGIRPGGENKRNKWGDALKQSIRTGL